MNVEKKKISDLTLCYWVTTLQHQGRRCLLAASEKAYACQLFDEYGNFLENVWEEPGGTMTAVALPGEESAFLATHRMYSPDDCKQASIVLCRWEADHADPGVHAAGTNEASAGARAATAGSWKIRTLAELPGVHRFDVLVRGGVRYLIACTIKSDYEYDDDWRFPGKVWACALPDNLTVPAGAPDALPEDYRLPLTVLREGQLKNHGYSRDEKDGVQTAIVTSEEGVFRFTPPEAPGCGWTVEHLLDQPTSDALFLDFDSDGEDELLTLSPFHGDTLRVFKKAGGRYEQVFEHEQNLPFLHAICPAEVDGKPIAVIGHRQGDRDLLAVYHEAGGSDSGAGRYVVKVLDRDIGPANAVSFELDGKTRILSANRETNEVAYYTVIW